MPDVMVISNLQAWFMGMGSALVVGLFISTVLYKNDSETDPNESDD